MVQETAIGGPRREFPPTRWTLISAAQTSAEARRAALGELLPAYWKPLYVCARYEGLDRDAAKDAIQGFCAELLEGDLLARLDPDKGSMRAYLKTALRNFLRDEHARATAARRGGGHVQVAVHDLTLAHEPTAPSEDPGRELDREWATAVMERAAQRLRAEFASGARHGPFELAARFLGFGDPPSYADAAREAGMGAVQLKAWVHRTRTRYRELVKDEVASTVAGDPELELASLLEALAR